MVEAKLESDISDIVGLFLFTPDLCILSDFAVFSNPLLAILARLYVLFS